MRFLLSGLICLSLSSFCQNSPIKPFGQVSMEEMNLKSCPYDSSAGAMIIFDKGEAEMDIDRGNSFKRHVRIKIFRQEEANEWATDVVYYDKEAQVFGKFKASTYNLVNGKIVETKIGDDGLFKGKFDKFTNQARFSLPQVTAGSIIEYTFTISAMDATVSVPDWQFQYTIPVAWSEYNMIIPQYFTFQKDWQGKLRPTHTETQGLVDRVYMQNVPAFKPEPLISSKENYISRLRLYMSEYWIPGQTVKKTIKSWGSIAKGVHDGDLGLQIRGSGHLKKIVEEQTAGITEPEKVVTALYDYVKRNVSWNDFSDVIPDRPFKEVLDSKKGSVSEINAMLISLLKKADINAEPVLVRTRDKGYIKSFLPVFSQFNYLICWVKIGDKTMLLDATEPHLPQTILPTRCLNGQGLLVSKEYYDWVDLTTPKSRRSVSGELSIDEMGTLSGKLTISREGNYASAMREEYKEVGEEKYVKDYGNGNWQISKSVFENVEDYKLPARETHELTISDYGQAAGPVLYLNPIVFGRKEENPFKLDKREYPVDYGSAFDEVLLVKINIPDGYLVDELPKPKAMVLPEGAGKYNYNVSVIGNQISVVSQFMLNKSTFTPEQYLFLREFYTQVIGKMGEQIVLKKKL